MDTNITKYQIKVLEVLANKIDDFYLAGGTALSLYYFHHRVSLDLDFFTQSFSRPRIFEIIRIISSALKRKVDLTAQESRKGRVKILVYSISINKKEFLKVDFVHDYLDCIKPPKLINGLKILSLEDIYIRKIYALSGIYRTVDCVGKRFFKGGRQEAKDFYDVYCLSQIFMKLSVFLFRYGTSLMRESIIRWFKTYDRLAMKSGLLELQLKKDADYRDIERHFKREVDEILEKEVDFI